MTTKKNVSNQGQVINKGKNPQYLIDLFQKIIAVSPSNQSQIYDLYQQIACSTFITMAQLFYQKKPDKVKDLIGKLKILQDKQYEDKVKQKDIIILFSLLRKQFIGKLQHVEQEKYFNQQRKIPRSFQQKQKFSILNANQQVNDEIPHDKKQTKQINSQYEQQQQLEHFAESKQIQLLIKFIMSHIDKKTINQCIKQEVLEKTKQCWNNISSCVIIVLKWIIWGVVDKQYFQLSQVIFYSISALPILYYWIKQYLFEQRIKKSQEPSKQEPSKQKSQTQNSSKQQFCCIKQRIREVAINSVIKNFFKQRLISQKITNLIVTFNKQQTQIYFVKSDLNQDYLRVPNQIPQIILQGKIN